MQPREGSVAYNLFIAYDLVRPGQNYDAVRDRIKDLGQWHQFQLSLFYVNTTLEPDQAYNHVAAVMDASDRLAVINAQGGVVSTWEKPPIEELDAVWLSP